MSRSDIALSVRGLSKSYSIGTAREQHSTLAESLIAKVRAPFRRETEETFQALDEVSFEINKGDVVGIVGRNGAGKSTLLKVLSRITEPTSGQIDLYGRIGSLLEVGTGFHPELTGRENIFLNGAILGMRQEEITRHFDAIVDFAGVEQFLDTPVKRYSSGMYVRLAFAVAAHLESEILVVDEVLAVGDAEFQRKCIGKMKDVATCGRTVLFVSHHMQSINVLCSKAMYMHKGTISHFGEVSEAISHYAASFANRVNLGGDERKRPGTGEFRFTEVAPTSDYFECGVDKVIRFNVRRDRSINGRLFISCLLVDEMGVEIVQCDSRLVEFWLDGGEDYSGKLTIRSPWLKPGDYRVHLFLCSSGIIDHFEDACMVRVIPLLPYKVAANPETINLGLVFADFTYNLT